MLKLVVNNQNETCSTSTELCSPNMELFHTCRNTCMRFDAENETCGLQLTTDIDNPFTPHSCKFFTEESVWYDMGSSEFEDDDDFDLLDITIQAMAQDNVTDLSDGQYPKNAGIDSLHDSTIWYTSEEGYGCWIINDYKKRFFLVDEIENDHSLLPTRPHKASKRLAPHVCWHINEDGRGKYCLLIGGLVVEIPEGVDIYE